jgi:hypothetical protein
MKRASIVLAIASVLLVSCRSVKEAGESTALAVGVTAMVAVSPAIPVVDAVRKIDGKVDRSLLLRAVYRVEPSVYVIPNSTGWFVDRAEQHQSMSAWIVDTRTTARDKNGRIVLDWRNLSRWYLRDHDRSALESIPAWRKDSAPKEYFRHESGDPDFELFVEGTKFIVILTQEKQPNQALQTTSVTRRAFGKVPVSDRQRRGV